ncbi:hypothetical protein [Algoriphagus sp. Y33]|uniref:hypothetical protein n=1 Tax=Algoriphagus sp. Y33 TaxID=2772483 RepID=UPI00177B69CD|nr:hypothetical protein [Algoriphagus sp. Y33]
MTVTLFSLLYWLGSPSPSGGDDRSSLHVPMAIGITKSYVAFASLLVEKAYNIIRFGQPTLAGRRHLPPFQQATEKEANGILADNHILT